MAPTIRGCERTYRCGSPYRALAATIKIRCHQHHHKAIVAASRIDDGTWLMEWLEEGGIPASRTTPPPRPRVAPLPTPPRVRKVSWHGSITIADGSTKRVNVISGAWIGFRGTDELFTEIMAKIVLR